MGTYATWLPDVLEGAGCKVVTHAGWRTRGHYGGFTGLRAVVWHHDASAKGDSPGVPNYMLGNWDNAGAQLWVDRRGVWHVLAAGPAYHAGKVRPGQPGNRNSLGVETDHTTGEDWPPALLDSLRKGTAAILTKLGVAPGVGLAFHKTICEPRGRKTDPDGLDLATEQRRVAAIDSLPSPALPVSPPKDGYDMADLKDLESVVNAALDARRTQSAADVWQYVLGTDPLAADRKVDAGSALLGARRDASDARMYGRSSIIEGRTAAENGTATAESLLASVESLPADIAAETRRALAAALSDAPATS